MAQSKEQIAKQVMAEEAKCTQDQARLDYEQTVHADKVNNSAAMFQNTKVTSCSKIL